MKFKPKTGSAAAASQPKSATTPGSAGRKFAVPPIPRPAGLGGKPSRPSTGGTGIPDTPTSATPTNASRAGISTSPTSPTVPLRPAHANVNALSAETAEDRSVRQPSASPVPPTLAANTAITGVPKLVAAERTRKTPTPSPAPAQRSLTRAGSQGRRSTTPSARINGKLALLAAAENANVPLHIPASMDRKKRKLAAEAVKGRQTGEGGVEEAGGMVSEISGGQQTSAGQKEPIDASGLPPSVALTTAGRSAHSTSGASSVQPSDIHSTASTAPVIVEPPAAETDETSVEAIANRAIAELFRSATASRATTLTPVGSAPASTPVSRAGSTAIDGEAPVNANAQEDVPAEFLQANRKKTKGMGMRKSRKRKVDGVWDEGEDESGERLANGPSKKPRGAAAAKGKGKGKGAVGAVGDEGEGEELDAGEEDEEAEGEEGEGEDVDIEEASQAGSTAKGKGRKRKGDHKALYVSHNERYRKRCGETGETCTSCLHGMHCRTIIIGSPRCMPKDKLTYRQRKKHEPMFPRPDLTDSQPGQLVGSLIDENTLTMSDLATVRSGEGRISRKSQKWQDKASELNKKRRDELEARMLDHFAARRPQRRFIRRKMNEMRVTRRAEVEARGGNGDEEVSADEEDSEFELEEDQVVIRRMSPEKTPDVDGSEERARRVAEEDRRARGGAKRGPGGEGGEGEDAQGALEDGDEEGEGEGEGEGEEGGDEGEGEDDENMEAHHVHGKWIRVPRGETPEGVFSYTLRRLGHVEAVRRDVPDDDEGAGGGAEGETDIWGNFNASGYDEDHVDVLAAQLHAQQQGAVDYGDEDDPDRVVNEIEENNAFVNSASWSKTQGRGEKWDKDQTDALYYYLSIFGENFSEMENFFPERTHRQIKLKARREQRNNRAKYEAFFNNRRQPDADELEQIVSWRSAGRTRAAQKLLEETLLAPGILAKADAELRRKRKRKGGKREHEQDAEASGARERAAAGGTGLEDVQEEGEDGAPEHANNWLDGGKEDEEYEEGEGEEGQEGEEGEGEEMGEGEEGEEPLFTQGDDDFWSGFG